MRRLAATYRALLRRLAFAAALAMLFLAPLARAHAADPNKYLREAMKLYERGQYEKAMKQFVKVLELDPSQPTAKEYMMLCSQKIVEKKLGVEGAATVERELAMEKQIQSLQPSTTQQAPADPYKALDDLPLPEEASTQAARGASPAQALPASPTAAKDIVEQRDSLTEEFRRRHIGRENIIQLDESRSQVIVTLFMNRLFLPYTSVLRDESFVALDHVVSQLRNDKKRKVVLKAVDASSPAVQSALPDLASRRCSALFSYLIAATYRP